MKWGRGCSNGRYATVAEGEGVLQEEVRLTTGNEYKRTRKPGATGGPITGHSRVPATGKETA
jgi:hypothetical protein